MKGWKENYYNDEVNKRKDPRSKDSKEFERAENNEEVLTPKAYQSLRAQILCDAQGGI